MKTTTAIVLAAMLAAGAASAQTSTPTTPSSSTQAQSADQMDGMANANPSSKDMTTKKSSMHAKKHSKTHSTSQGTSGTRGNTNAAIDKKDGDANTGAVAPTDAVPPNAAPNSSMPTAPNK